MYVSHPKVPNGTKIISISGTTISMSSGASATASSTGRFSPVLDAQTLGATGGSIGHVLITAQAPAHTHSGTTGAMSANATHTHTISASSNILVMNNGGSGISNFAGGPFLAQALTSVASIVTTNTDHTHNFTTDSGTGGGAAHNNTQSTIVMNFMIKR
jgi:microcystin-dependent protein